MENIRLSVGLSCGSSHMTCVIRDIHQYEDQALLRKHGKDNEGYCCPQALSEGQTVNGTGRESFLFLFFFVSEQSTASIMHRTSVSTFANWCLLPLLILLWYFTAVVILSVA